MAGGGAEGVSFTHFAVLVAQGRAVSGALDEGLAILDEALEQLEPGRPTQWHYFEPQVGQVRAELLMRRGGVGDAEAAELLGSTPMPWLMATVYDRIMASAERACLSEWRRELLASLEGRVLEVGAGTGASLEAYPEAVGELVMTEPDPHMRVKLEARARERPGTRVIADPVENLGVAEGSFDAVVSSLLLCSVEQQSAALAELSRVLRPGGRLLFLEHVAAWDDDGRLRWQRRLEPVWKHVAGNCHLTRDTERAILDAGFELETISRESMRKAIPWLRPCIRGFARKPAARPSR